MPQRGTTTNDADMDDDQLDAVRPGPPRRAARKTTTSGSSGAGYWPIVAIIAIIAATAGWTTVAVMALNGGSGTSALAPVASDDGSATDDPNASFDDTGVDASDAPVPDSHDAPELEALLPTVIAGTPVSTQSWTGDTLLADGGSWSTAIESWLTTVGKKPADMTAAQAVDPTDSIDHSVGVFVVDGISAKDLQAAMIDAWKGDFPDLGVSTVKLDGTEVTKGDFGQDAINSYWYEKDGKLYDIETSDEAVATAMLKGIRDGTFASGSEAPAGSAAPSEPAASPSAS